MRDEARQPASDAGADDGNQGHVMTQADFLRRMLAGFRPYKGRALLLGCLLLLDVGFQAAVPLSFQILVDRAIAGRDLRVLTLTLSALGLGILVVTAGGLVRDRLYADLGSRVLGDLRQRIFDHLQRLSMDFHGRSRVGDLLSRFSGDLAGVETAMTNAIPWGVLPALDVSISTMLLFWLDWRLALLSLLVWPLSLAGPRIVTPYASSASYARKGREADTISTVQENLLAQPVVKAFSLGRRAQRSFAVTNEALVRAMARFGFLSALVERSAGIGIQILQVVILGVGAWMAFMGSLTVGSLAAFQTLFLSLSSSLSYLSQFVPSLLMAAGGMTRIDELLSLEPRVTDAADAREFDGVFDRLTFEDVSFGYREGDLVLNSVSLDVRSGQSVAFVGPSGSGKSTALNLLLRFHDPSSGVVRINEHDIKSLVQDSYRERIGIVFQDNFLFNTSLRENIRLGLPTATDAEVEGAARSAEIHDFIKGLPEGYETRAGERGGRLSGGQRQRIGIARALLRDPAILLLDEATSALDAFTEAAINRTLAKAGAGRTVVSVTHRLQAAIHCDRIFVLDHGRLIEQGTHGELLRLDRVYRELWEKQSGFEFKEGGHGVSITGGRLRGFPILERLDLALLERLARSFVSERHAPGRVVIHEGDAGDKFYVIARGSLEVLKGDMESSPRVSVLQDGDYFGEVALLRDVPRTASVRTLTGCVLLSLQREPFQALIEIAPELRAQFRDLRVNDPTIQDVTSRA